MTQLSAATEKIAVMPDVADLQLRPPAMLAKAAASLSVPNGGRVQLAVGGGAPFPDAIASMGVEPRSGRELVDFVAQSIGVLHSGMRGAPVWVGAQRPGMLKLIGRQADGWVSPLNIYVPPDEVPAKQQIIDDAAVAAGRDPSEIRRLYNVIGTIGNATRGSTGLVGDVRAWTDFLTDAVTDLGFDTFIFWPTHDAVNQLDTFAREVIPAVRSEVEQKRSAR